MLNKIKESKDNNIQTYNKKIIDLFEKNETLFDGKREQGAIDFKMFILDRYFQLGKEIEAKDNNIWIKYLKLIKKYLENETEDIGKRINKYLLCLTSIKNNQISETNLRVYIELLIYINANAPK